MKTHYALGLVAASFAGGIVGAFVRPLPTAAAQIQSVPVTTVPAGVITVPVGGLQFKNSTGQVIAALLDSPPRFTVFAPSQPGVESVLQASVLHFSGLEAAPAGKSGGPYPISSDLRGSGLDVALTNSIDNKASVTRFGFKISGAGLTKFLTVSGVQ